VRFQASRGESDPVLMSIIDCRLNLDLGSRTDDQGEHLLTAPEGSARLLSSAPSITPFPVYTLPLQSAIRFADLFLTRPRWRPDDMTPFLKGLYRDGDSKERDKLITKFVRVVKEKEGTWWYPRRTA
jgi:sister chromatid cohesion protein DCC1